MRQPLVLGMFNVERPHIRSPQCRGFGKLSDDQLA
jgi:hypothetical protein